MKRGAEARESVLGAKANITKKKEHSLSEGMNGKLLIQSLSVLDHANEPQQGMREEISEAKDSTSLEDMLFTLVHEDPELIKIIDKNLSVCEYGDESQQRMQDEISEAKESTSLGELCFTEAQYVELRKIIDGIISVPDYKSQQKMQDERYKPIVSLSQYRPQQEAVGALEETVAPLSHEFNKHYKAGVARAADRRKTDFNLPYSTLKRRILASNAEAYMDGYVAEFKKRFPAKYETSEVQKNIEDLKAYIQDMPISVSDKEEVRDNPPSSTTIEYRSKYRDKIHEIESLKADLNLLSDAIRELNSSSWNELESQRFAMYKRNKGFADRNREGEINALKRLIKFAKEILEQIQRSEQLEDFGEAASKAKLSTRR